MLANNLCDVERDVAVKRYTLPYYIGKAWALRIYRLLYLAAYAAMLLSAATGTLHWVCLAAIGTLPLVWKNVGTFAANPVKAQTFVLTVKNFALLLYPYILTILIGWLLAWVF